MMPLELHRSPKVLGRGPHRVVHAAETLRRVRPLLPAVGITRVADITGLDRVGIPTYGAVIPDSRDVLSVYNGKGARKLDARVGAMMEAIERYSALEPDLEVHHGSYAALSAGRPVLRPRDLVLGMHPEYDDGQEIPWVEGTSLLEPGCVLVPLQAVQILFDPSRHRPCYTFSTTNGLASGNTPEEAVCHALCEIIERDAWTIAKLLVQYLPRARARRASGGDAARVEDDVERYPCLDLADAPPTVRRLLSRFERAGLSLMARDITSDLGIPVVLATVAEPQVGPGHLAHFGLGAHPDAEVALTRALTEVAQSRATDIHAVREDLSPADAPAHPFAAHTRRTRAGELNGWMHRPSSRRRPTAEMATHRHADVLEDIDVMVSALRRAGLGPVVAVDLTRRDLGVPVVRVLAGGAESWAADNGRLGPRALRVWRENGGELWTGP
jgi:ribosomal protein S12 methylthiotransferase accessory factor